MKIDQIYTGCLAEAAYYIESEGEAVIIDPLRETAPYLEKLRSEGAKLKYIFETHFHADFVSGHLDLAQQTDAQIVYGPEANPQYDVLQLQDGDTLEVGKLAFKVLHTPGHTLESTTYLLLDENSREHAIFTGDTLFLGDVGRPDLAIQQDAITQEDLAAMLYHSLRDKIMPLPDDVIVYPAHGAGSSCGKNLSRATWGVLGDQKKTNYALRADMSEEEFVQEVTAGLTPPPQYFAKNAMMNKAGYESFDDVLAQGAIAHSPDQFERLASVHVALVLDVRTHQEFVREHIPGSIFIGLDGSFAPWVGALVLDIKQPILLVVPAEREEEAVTRLARVGYDNTLGYLAGGVAAWSEAGKDVAQVRQESAVALADLLANQPNTAVLDVRRPSEFVSQHLEAAENLPLDYINHNMGRLHKNTEYYLHCRTGYRSVIAASILAARGYDVVDIAGGWIDLEKTDAATTNYVCPTELPQDIIDDAVRAVTT